MRNDSTSEDSKTKLSPIELIAAGTSGVILLFFAVYWIAQIRGVMEMLELAYG